MVDDFDFEINSTLEVKNTVIKGLKIAKAQLETYHLVDLPPNKITPKHLADWAVQTGKNYGIEVTVIGSEQAYILGCCPYDGKIHFVPSEGLDKIPDKALQKKADEAFEEIFNSPLGRLLPPY